MVECAGLEIRYTGLPYRGFESLPLRQLKGPRKRAFCLAGRGASIARDRDSKSRVYERSWGNDRLDPRFVSEPSVSFAMVRRQRVGKVSEFWWLMLSGGVN